MVGKERLKNSVYLVLCLIAVAVIGLAACAKEPPVLKRVGPSKTKAGVDFNVQSNGESAIWTITENATRWTVIIWGETKLHSTFGSSKNVTALVPRELYSKPGQVQVYLLDQKTGAKSNSLTFTVEE